jgi:Cdc6-like AAA superfamily ATPase
MQIGGGYGILIDNHGKGGGTMRPLADEIRPKTLDEVAGQKHLLGEGAMLRRLIESGTSANLIFYGPSGTGKTTIANIIAKKTEKTLYHLNATTASLQDVKSIIADVPMDKRIAVAMHASAFDYRNDKKPYNYTDKLLRILDGRRVNFITGHRHRHATTEFNDKVIEHNVAQVNGNLWFAPICSDGTPRSVFCIEERDGEWQWHYHTLGQEANKQLVVWNEGAVKDNEEYIVVKVVGWDDKWRVEWFEDGHSRGAMEQISIFDPDYAYYVENIANYNETVMARLRRSAEIYNHYYRCRRTSPNSEITIVATDRFGREFREVIRPTE